MSGQLKAIQDVFLLRPRADIVDYKRCRAVKFIGDDADVREITR